jgi:hypothetical protein
MHFFQHIYVGNGLKVLTSIYPILGVGSACSNKSFGFHVASCSGHEVRKYIVAGVNDDTCDCGASVTGRREYVLRDSICPYPQYRSLAT